ncbi:MAG: alpha-glycosidase [Lachnospiraceae bacterium]|nr:alpha-glycosidase [Lachnospiraceae bacterium]
MNQYAMHHVVDSSYCFPISPNEIVLRLRAARGDLVRAQVIYESKYTIGLTQKSADMRCAYRTELYDFFEVTLKLEDTRLGYVFYVNDGIDNYYFSEDGVTKTYNFALGFYNFFQYPYINEADIMECVPWMKKAVFYQIFVDRFCMGDSKKDTSYINTAWGEVPSPKSFCGGDIKGILTKLDYLQALGINAIYLTPVFSSISNHKYDISDYYQVDRQFGTNKDLLDLVEAAHARGMKIILDAVFNHCSDRLMQFQDVIAKGCKSEYYDWFVVYGDEISPECDNYETFASCKYMPKFNTSNAQVEQFLLDIATYYIKEYDIDGWRLDVSDEISHSFWRKFRQTVKGIKKDAVIIGENWHDANSNLRGDQYDSIMNYAFTKACLDYFATECIDSEGLAWKLNGLLMRNTDIVNSMMLNLLDSHDTHRFFKEVNEEEWKMKAALALLYLFRGAPCIFYGTEISIWGGYDPDCRRCMDWNVAGENGKYSHLWKLLTTLAQIRQTYDLAEGVQRIYAQKGIFYLENTTKQGTVLLCINPTKEDVRDEERIISAKSFCVEINGGVMIDG